MQLLDLCLIFIWYRFNGLEFLRNMKGKSMMFVGDSLGRNQWESLVCLISSSVPRSSTKMSRGEPFSIFKFLVSSPVSKSHCCHSTLVEMRPDKIHVLAIAWSLQGCNWSLKIFYLLESFHYLEPTNRWIKHERDRFFFQGSYFLLDNRASNVNLVK